MTALDLNPRPIQAFRALAVAAGTGLLAGAAAGFLDSTLSWISGGIDVSPGLYLYGVSFGALLGVCALLPAGLAFALLRRPRTAAGVMSASLAVLVLGAAAVPWGRRLYHGIPWDAGEWALAVGGGAVLLGALGLAARAGDGLGRRAPEGALSRAAGAVAVLVLPGLLLAAPAALRVVPALQPPVGYSVGRGDTNLLLLTVDTLRPDRMGCTGSPTARTPWIDRISRRGVQFSDCQSSAPWTLPSLGTVLTGSYPGEHRVLEEISGISPDVATLAEVSREAGRRTAAFVSNPWLAPGGLARGFETFDVAERLECLSEIRAGKMYGVVSRFLLRTRKLDSAERITFQGTEWIRRGEGAWFLWLHYFDPHLPNWPAAPYDRMFGPPPTHTELNLTVEQIREGDFDGGAEGRAEIVRLYDGEIAYTDRYIGALWKALSTAGELSRTAIVFSSDHGEEFWDHGGYGHGHVMYDHVVRVPLTVRVPGGEDGRVIADLVGTVDLARTACAAAGLDGSRFRGRNRLGGDVTPTFAYGEATLYGEEQKFLRTGEWKMIYRTESDVRELFRVRRDPAESDDLINAEPAVADSLFRQLRDLIAVIGSEGAMAARDPDLDPDILDQLEALGYVADD